MEGFNKNEEVKKEEDGKEKINPKSIFVGSFTQRELKESEIEKMLKVFKENAPEYPIKDSDGWFGSLVLNQYSNDEESNYCASIETHDKGIIGHGYVPVNGGKYWEE